MNYTTIFDDVIKESIGMSAITPHTEIRIPKLDVQANVIDVFLSNPSWNVDELHRNVGRLEGTGRFDARDNVVLTGHAVMADGAPGVFAQIAQLNAGDEVIVARGSMETQYVITTKKRVRFDDLSVLDHSNAARLTLIACATDSYDDLEGDYLERHVLIAEPAMTDKQPSSDSVKTLILESTGDLTSEELASGW
jgi:LPXTG-site transpeptidase (sortase) family protein